MTDSETEDKHTLELTQRQRDRLDAIKAECKEADPGLPPPSDEMMMSSLLDTWDAVNEGLYSNQNSDCGCLLSRLKSALSPTALKEVVLR